jgi:hypothetical protein
MAEINHEFDKASAIAIPAHRVERMEGLYSNEGWEWLHGKLCEREQELVAAACDIRQPEEVNRAARIRLDEIRRIITMPRIELATASKDLKEEIKKSDPGAPTTGPML